VATAAHSDFTDPGKEHSRDDENRVLRRGMGKNRPRAVRCRVGISLADPGPFGAAKETMATLKSATNPPSREQLLAEVALEVQAMAHERQHPLKGYRPAKGGGTSQEADSSTNVARSHLSWQRRRRPTRLPHLEPGFDG